MRHDGTDKAERERGAEVCARADAAHAAHRGYGSRDHAHRARHGLLPDGRRADRGPQPSAQYRENDQVRARSAAARGARRERGNRRRTLPAQHLRRRRGGGARHRRANRGHEEADRFARARRGTLHRRAAGRCAEALAHRAERVHDRPPHPHERHAHRRAADLSLLRPPAGAHRALCDEELRHIREKAACAHAGRRGHGRRRRQHPLRRGGGPTRTKPPASASATSWACAIASAPG